MRHIYTTFSRSFPCLGFDPHDLKEHGSRWCENHGTWVLIKSYEYIAKPEHWKNPGSGTRDHVEASWETNKPHGWSGRKIYHMCHGKTWYIWYGPLWIDDDPPTYAISLNFHHGTYLVGGIPTLLKNMKVSWDYEIPKICKNKIHVPNHQPVSVKYQDAKDE